MFLLFVFIYLFSTPVFASPIVNIVTPPSNIVVGNSFPVTFTISSGDTGLSYRYKIVADTESNIITQPLSSCSGNWDNCPIINIGNTDPVTATAYAKLNNVTSATIKIRIAQDNNHSSVFVSNSISISGISPTSTFTPTPTPTQPSNTPVPPTSTPMPTSTTIPSVTVSPRPTSTKLPSPTITPTPLPTETPYFEPTPTTPATIDSPNDIPDLIFPTPTPKSTNFLITPTIISIAFITVGCLLLLIPVIIIKLNR